MDKFIRVTEVINLSNESSSTLQTDGDNLSKFIPGIATNFKYTDKTSGIKLKIEGKKINFSLVLPAGSLHRHLRPGVVEPGFRSLRA